MRRMHVAVAVVGQKNVTRISSIRPFSEETLNGFAKFVASRPAGKLYYVYEFSEDGRQRKKGDPMLVWHVGDGFEHQDGWWTELE